MAETRIYVSKILSLRVFTVTVICKYSCASGVQNGVADEVPLSLHRKHNVRLTEHNSSRPRTVLRFVHVEMFPWGD